MKADERDRLAKIMLAELSQAGPLRRRELHKRMIRRCATPATFVNILNYLKRHKYIEKTSAKHTAPYRITEKGRKWLEILLEEP